METLDVGSHGVVDRRVKFPQKRHETQAYLVATGIELGVGVVLDIVEVVFDNVGVDIGPREAE